MMEVSRQNFPSPNHVAWLIFSPLLLGARKVLKSFDLLLFFEHEDMPTAPVQSGFPPRQHSEASEYDVPLKRDVASPARNTALRIARQPGATSCHSLAAVDCSQLPHFQVAWVLDAVRSSAVHGLVPSTVSP